MRLTALLFILLMTRLLALTQEVDLLRLAYDRPNIQSAQEGMAVSPDGKFIAFVYEDKTIKLFETIFRSWFLTDKNQLVKPFTP
ncbi:MAG TPA: hypothetical protein VIS49_07110 [Cyclobacteriaceae bacterium]